MNNIYLIGKITNISKVKFDINHKLQAVVMLEVADVENVFRVKLIDRMCEFCYLHLCVGKSILLYGHSLGSGLIIANTITRY